MSEAAAHLAAFGLGLLGLLPLRRRLGIGLACALAHPLGLAGWVLVSLFLLWTPWDHDEGARLLVLAGLLLAGATASLRSLRADPLDRAAIRTLIAVGLAFLGAAALCSAVNLTVVTVDSLHYVGVGRRLASFGGVPGELTHYGVFQLLLQGTSVPLGLDYLHAAGPLLALDGAACLALASGRALAALRPTPAPARVARRAALLGVLAWLAATSASFPLSQALALHTNHAASIYLLLFCACFWLAELEGEAAWVPVAFVFLLAFSLQRLELPVFAALFAALAGSQTSLPARRVLPWMAGWAAVLVVWYWQLAGAAGATTRLLTADRAVAIALLVALTPVGVALSRTRALARLRPALPALLLTVCGAAVVAAAIARPEAFVPSSMALLRHLVDPAWGLLWPALLGLSLLAWRAPRVPLERLPGWGSAGSLLLIAAAGSVREGGHYHPALTDSGNRMLLHVVPSLLLYLVVVLGRDFAFSRARPDSAAPPPSARGSRPPRPA